MDYQRVLDNVRVLSSHKEEEPLDISNITNITSELFSKMEKVEDIDKELKEKLM